MVKIRISNFKSIKQIDLELQDQNVLIGANNSGKTNTMNALKFWGDILSGSYPDSEKFKNVKCNLLNVEYPMSIYAIEKQGKEYLHNYFVINRIKKIENRTIINYRIINGFCERDHFIDNLSTNDLSPFDNVFKKKYEIIDNYEFYEIKNRINHFVKVNSTNQYKGYHHYKIDDKIYIIENLPEDISKIDFKFLTNFFIKLSSSEIYRPLVNIVRQAGELKEAEYRISPDASNIVSVIDNFQDTYPEIIEQINKTLNRLIPEFKGVRFQKVNGSTHKIIGLINKWNKIIWPDSISDGVLYLLAIIAIIHQKEQLRFLMIEEPENNIHPRRISEIIRLIWELSESRTIPIIISTHSPVVLQEFREFPQSVHIFEMKDGETKVENLQNIIEKANKQFKDNNLSEEELLDCLGENWVSGFFGGVPNV